ncbi:MAG: LysM peptidoglycan-binding domain-containing protein [Clostridiales bacterium]|nr:LysM peptidoglycan-binding domain-containing protein [Clostridiales bacterium]
MRTLRVGSAGQEVYVLQTALMRAGFNPGDIDGIFGTRTLSAVQRFQRVNGLIADGIVGMLTWSRLRPYLVGYVIHSINRGETFWQLAEKYNTSVNAIRVANPNVNPLNITTGTQIVVPLNFDVVPTEIPISSEMTALIVEGLAMRYPFISVGSLGNSVMGKDLLYMRLGTGRTQVSYNATHHANEWITSIVLLKYVEDLSFANATGGNIYNINASELLSRVNLAVVPMVNPDGVDLASGVLNQGTFYNQARAISAAYPDIPFPEGWKANIIGTDLNLNYPAGWELARDTKFAQGFTSPAPRDYVGTEPLSAPESQAMEQFTLQNDFRLTLAYHTQGRVIFWKYLDYEPPRSREIGEAFAASSGYELSLTPPESAYAGYKDWFIQTYNRPGYTVEVGVGTSPLPLSQFPIIYNNNIGILTLGMALI